MPTSKHRVWIAMKGNEQALTLSEADGWEVREVAKAPACRPNSPEDIRQSMNLLQHIHRDKSTCDVHDHLLPDGNCNCPREASRVETSAPHFEMRGKCECGLTWQVGCHFAFEVKEVFCTCGRMVSVNRAAVEPADDCYIHGPGTFPHSDGCRCSKCSPERAGGDKHG